MITHCNYNIREIADVEDFKKKIQMQTTNDTVIIQTCKRLEIYSGYGEMNEETARHLFRLVCGLDSVFIGDTAVKAQVKKAYIESAGKGKLSKNMHRLFQVTLVEINDITHKLFKWLVQSGVSGLNIVNRTRYKLEGIPESSGKGTLPLSYLPRLLEISDVLILCTSAPGYLLSNTDIPSG